MDRIKESDWKLLSRKLKPQALDDFCERVFAKIEQLAGDTDRSWRERCLALWKLIREEDTELGLAFDDLRRSTAIRQLACMRRLGLVADEDYAQFSEETRSAVELLLSLGR